MARKKKSMIGVDPLAWLDGDKAKEGASEPESASVVKEQAAEESKPKSHKIDVLGIRLDEIALVKGYEISADSIDEIVKDFYGRLFEQYPDVKPLFRDFDEDAQSSKLIQALRLLMDNLHDEDALNKVLAELGVRHQKYGALKEHYPVVIELLLASFKEKIGRHWTKAITMAWQDLLTVASEKMCNAYEVDMEQPETNQVNNELETGSCLQLHSVQDISRSQALKNDMLSLINDNDQISIDGSQVERIDGSAMQLICALFLYAKEHNLMISWINPADVIIEAASTLGMKDILELAE